jgi:peptidoglycan/xylan/chitin deacetylase (PgdA/CDA1 family)
MLLEQIVARGHSFASVGETIENNKPTAIAVTFDDGYAQLGDTLPDLVQRFGLRPTVFIPTDYLGRENSWDYSSVFRRTRHLDAAAIRELAAIGVEFGAHGHRHVDLTRCGERELLDELRRPKKMLEDILGTEVIGLSYPFGRTNRAVIEAAERAGYRYGLTMRFPKMADEPLAVGRLPVYGFDSAFSLRQKVENGPLCALESLKCGITNRLSAGTSLWRYLAGR